MTPFDHWAFHNPVRLQFGRGSRRALVEELAGLRVLAVSSARGREQFTIDELVGPIAKNLSWVDSVTANPGISVIEKTLNYRQNQSVDAVLAFGGGSAIDFGKAVSALLAPGLRSQDLRRLISAPETLLTHQPLPLFVLPTTAGTGSEVTPFATIWDHENKRKLSLASPSLFPKVAIVDPQLTDQLPAEATFWSGLDALNQAFESVWNKNSTAATLALAGRAISLALAALPALLENLGDRHARDQMAEASLLAGLSISQTKTALCHSMSYPLTAHFGIPHGLACAFTMAEVFSRCVTQTPEIFGPVIKETNHNTADELLLEVSTLLSRLEVRAKVTRSVGTLDSLLSLSSEMDSTQRSENFLLPVDRIVVHEILTSSYFRE